MSHFADVNMSIVEGIWIKQMHFKEVGWMAQTHAHNYDHQTLLAAGSLLVTVGSDSVEYVAPAILVIHAHAPHVMIALQPNTVAYCIHKVREDASIVEGIPNNQLQSLA